jgi:cytochrome c553
MYNSNRLRATVSVLSVVLSMSLIAVGSARVQADDAPAWTLLIPDKDQPPENRAAARRVPGSTKTYTLEQIDDGSNPPDWFPTKHTPAPTIVSHGSPPDVPACAQCHLYSGEGHPESANLAGQPAGYLAQQLADYKSGARIDPARMSAIGKGLSDADARRAADWFASLTPTVWFRAVEISTIPKTRVTPDHLRVRRPGTATEALGNRIIEVAKDADRALDRDPSVGFVSYVPPGSIAKGKTLLENGAEGRSVACATCHGVKLQGLGEVPRIAGLSAVYVGRQLSGFRGTARTGPIAEPMRAAAAKLTNDDILYLAAYLVSLSP